MAILKRNRKRFTQGVGSDWLWPPRFDSSLDTRSQVVHSYTGTAAEAKELLALDMFIGINGCSLRTGLVTISIAVTIARGNVHTLTDWCVVSHGHE